MSSDLHSPPFGEADLTNCERELIHLAASIQPHGVLLVLHEPELTVVQASANAASLLGVEAEALLGQKLAALPGSLDLQVRQALAQGEPAEPVALAARVALPGREARLDGRLHREPAGALVLELEAAEAAAAAPSALREQLQLALQRCGRAASIATLADAVVKSFREITGYDRVMVYRFDPDGHGKIIAEARDPRLESLLGHHYPASDIPQRARELYLRNRVRVLVDAHYEPVPLVPRFAPHTGADLDMSLSALRSMSPLHTQYLKNMGVTATLVVSLVREGKLWGLVAAHHYAPLRLPGALRVAAELLGEVVSTRIAAIENYAHAQVAILVRRLEQRLIEATSSEGDWRLALFRNPRTLLQPLEATGAALFHEDEVLTSGEVPSTPELRALLRWIDERHVRAPAGAAPEPPYACSSIGKENPALESLTPVASGVLAVRLSTSRPDWLIWFRKEQLTSVTWAGDPTKPMVGNDPLQLSPRRSFAAWSEIVRGTAVPWTPAELLLARAVGTALVDIVVQVHAVRLLIAEHQLAQTRRSVANANEPVLIADPAGRVLYTNDAFARLLGPAAAGIATLDDLAPRFATGDAIDLRLRELRQSQQGWRGETALQCADAEPVPVSLRAEVVQGRDGQVLGAMLLFTDLRDNRRALAARRHLEESLARAAALQGVGPRASDALMNAILTNASVAAMDIADASADASVARLMEELEASTRRAAALYEQLPGDEPG